MPTSLPTDINMAHDYAESTEDLWWSTEPTADPPPPYHRLSPPPPEHRYDLALLFSSTEAPAPSPTVDRFDSFHTILTCRYGLIDTSSSSTPIPSQSVWEKTCKVLGETLSMTGMDLAERGGIQRFTDLLLEQKITRMSDLSTDLLSVARTNSNFSVCEVMIWCRERQWNTFAIQSSPDDADAPLWILTCDAASAAQAIRTGWGPSLFNIARKFLERGIPFQTLVSGRVSASSVHLPLIGLGSRVEGYKPTSEDYTEYESKRNELLSLPRVARAAFMKGGIVWRLAVEASVSIDHVFAGPMDEESVNHHDMWDNQLTNDELDLICGVYRVHTGKFVSHTINRIFTVVHIGYGQQVAECSWWPKMTAWEGNGLDFGYWNLTCETWFQKRLEKIKENPDALRTAKQWKNALMFQKRTPKVIAWNNELTANYLRNRTV